MKTSESLVILFGIASELKGPALAKDFVSSIVYNVISEVLEENLPLTAEEIDRRVAKEAQDLKASAEASKKSIA